ncbi:sulfotransferase family protein [Thiomicrolovo sp. ZZH C-3]
MNKYFNPKSYVNFFLNKTITILSPLIAAWEKKYISKYSSLSLKHQPVFIIGAPRTGSTILYQTLTNQLDVLYIDNLVCRFHKHLFFGFWLSNKLFKQKAHNCFRSNHGNTAEYGLRAPSECAGYWYRWLPKDRHFIDYDDITDMMVQEIRQEISAVINYFDKPLIFKNLNAGQRMKLITRAFPDAKFIFIKRDPLYTAQSILKAKRSIGIDDNTFWSVMPENVERLRQLNAYEQIVKQIYYLEKQINVDKKLIRRGHLLEVHYTDLTDTSKSQIIKEFLNGNIERKAFQPSDIRVSEKDSLPEAEIHALKQEIAKLDWKAYND